MASFALLLTLLLVASACVFGKVVEHTFEVQTLTVNRLCQEQVITAVNGKYPGPTIYAHEGDTLIVHVVNKSPSGITIHWHGIQVLFNGWSDGAAYITQCPILPGDSYTYKFNITKQEGTFWWHAHLSWLRATVHGALIIYPKVGRPYPFQKPYKESAIVIGEWFKSDIILLENQYLYEDMGISIPDALTINGQPGDFYQCSSKDTFKLKVKKGETYLLRIINAGLNRPALFYQIANHKMTVVSADACYTNPYVTDVVVIAPGQTVDVLLKADQPPASYYMEVHTRGDSTNKSSGILIYDGATSTSSVLPVVAAQQDFEDLSIIYNFSSSLVGLTTGPFWVPVPKNVDEHMFITVGLGMVPCDAKHNNCLGEYHAVIYGSMNNISFQLPTKTSLLEAFIKNIDGIYTTDFPIEPPTKFDYVNPDNSENDNLMWIGEFATKVKKLRFNTTIQIVLQNTCFFNVEYHPIHLHGYNFYVLAQGFGNYDPQRDERSFNLINPQQRNTLSVPKGGWAVIRFQANNPGAWLMHCHLDLHTSVGLTTAFLVENGPSNSTSLPPPPLDLPKCNYFEIYDSSEMSTGQANFL